MKSLYRALDKKLFLIVKKNRKEFAWQFPQGSIEEGETIRQVKLSSFLNVHCLGGRKRVQRRMQRPEENSDTFYGIRTDGSSLLRLP